MSYNPDTYNKPSMGGAALAGLFQGFGQGFGTGISSSLEEKRKAAQAEKNMAMQAKIQREQLLTHMKGLLAMQQAGGAVSATGPAGPQAQSDIFDFAMQSPEQQTQGMDLFHQALAGNQGIGQAASSFPAPGETSPITQVGIPQNQAMRPAATADQYGYMNPKVQAVRGKAPTSTKTPTPKSPSTLNAAADAATRAELQAKIDKLSQFTGDPTDPAFLSLSQEIEDGLKKEGTRKLMRAWRGEYGQAPKMEEIRNLRGSRFDQQTYQEEIAAMGQKQAATPPVPAGSRPGLVIKSFNH